MTKKQQGFTLIELVAVIVILGALAVVALPRFVDLQDEAQQASAEGVAGAISSAFAVNFAASSASSSEAKPVNVDDNLQIGGTAGSSDFNINTIMQTELSDYEVAGADGGSCGWASGGPGTTSTNCVVQHVEANSVSAPFTAIATSS